MLVCVECMVAAAGRAVEFGGERSFVSGLMVQHTILASL